MNRRRWWATAVLACLGDVLTTWYGIAVLSLPESNPIMNAAMVLIGILPALIATKLVLLSVAYVCYRICDEYEWIVPLALIVVNWPVTILNLAQIYVTVL